MAEYATSIEIHASPEEVFQYLVTPEGMTAWMGEYAVLDPRQGAFSRSTSPAPRSAADTLKSTALTGSSYPGVSLAALNSRPVHQR